jgi:hypothetical protein
MSRDVLYELTIRWAILWRRCLELGSPKKLEPLAIHGKWIIHIESFRQVAKSVLNEFSEEGIIRIQWRDLCRVRYV